MNLKELREQINSIPEEFDDFTVVKSHSMPKCRVDESVKVIYI